MAATLKEVFHGFWLSVLPVAEKRRFCRQRLLREWREWLADPMTLKAVLPISGVVLLAGFGGWYAGSQQFCRPLFQPPGVQQAR